MDCCIQHLSAIASHISEYNLPGTLNLTEDVNYFLTSTVKTNFLISVEMTTLGMSQYHKCAFPNTDLFLKISQCFFFCFFNWKESQQPPSCSVLLRMSKVKPEREWLAYIYKMETLAYWSFFYPWTSIDRISHPQLNPRINKSIQFTIKPAFGTRQQMWICCKNWLKGYKSHTDKGKRLPGLVSSSHHLNHSEMLKNQQGELFLPGSRAVMLKHGVTSTAKEIVGGKSRVVVGKWVEKLFSTDLCLLGVSSQPSQFWWDLEWGGGRGWKIRWAIIQRNEQAISRIWNFQTNKRQREKDAHRGVLRWCPWESHLCSLETSTSWSTHPEPDFQRASGKPWPTFTCLLVHVTHAAWRSEGSIPSRTRSCQSDSPLSNKNN